MKFNLLLDRALMLLVFGLQAGERLLLELPFLSLVPPGIDCKGKENTENDGEGLDG